MPVPLLPLAIAAGGAAVNYFGQKSANKANLKEAGTNRKFQERMRNTQWQAGVADMRAAGINPALAYSQGGASAPSGSVGAKQENVGAGISGNAMQMAMMTAQLKLLQAQAEKTSAEGREIALTSRSSTMRVNREAADYGMYFNTNGTLKNRLRVLMFAQHDARMAVTAQEISRMKSMKLSLSEQKAVAALFDSVGGPGAGAKILGPLLISFLRGIR